MPKLSPVSWQEFVKRMRAIGFEGPFAGGKHPYMIWGDTVLTVPNPHRKEIGVALLSRILKEARVSHAEWDKSK
jgi:predicted RNA binding protein YcfA (HicA-like mRNA interferase family)